MPARRAGQHARETTRRKAITWLGVLALLVLVGAIVGSVAGFTSPVFLATEAVLILGVCAIDRLAVPVIDRWDQGATGEEQVGVLLEAMRAEGWLTVHDVNTGRGNIDTIVIGPGGLFTIEVKSHRGRVWPDRLGGKMLDQPYAQAKWLQAITGRDVSPLLVFSHAYIVGRPVSRQRGVTVLPARMLAGHLRRRPVKLSGPEAVELHARLRAAVSAVETRAA